MQKFVQVYFDEVELHIFKNNYLKFNITPGRRKYSIGTIAKNVQIIMSYLWTKYHNSI